MHRPTRSRGLLAVALGVIVLAGAGTARGTGPIADLAGSALYAVAVALTLALVVSRARTTALALAAAGVAVAVELAQLTSAPASLVDLWPGVRYIVGTTFHAPDLLGYAVGALAFAAVDRREVEGRRVGSGASTG